MPGLAAGLRRAPDAWASGDPPGARYVLNKQWTEGSVLETCAEAPETF